MKMNFIFTILFAVTVTSVFAQKKNMDVRNLDLEQFPDVKGTLWIRNPEKINTDQITFYENGKPLNVNFSSAEHSDTLAKNKAILFLVLRTNNNRELDWYQDVLREIADKGVLKPGDKYAIASFSVKDGDHFLYPRNFIFTDKKDQFKMKVDSLDQHPLNRKYKGRNQVYLAVNEALSMMEAAKLSMPKGIIILSDDRNMMPNFQGEDPVERSKKLDIPLYGITYFNNKFSYETPDLCAQTYGFHFTEAGNDVVTATVQLTGYLNGFNDRYAGLYYPFFYTSSFEKDGQSHTVKVDSQSDQTAFILNSPNKTLGEWIEENLILFVAIILVVIFSIVMLIILIRKRNKKRREDEQLKEEHLKELERIQSESDRKIALQENEIKGIQNRAQQEKTEQEALKRQAEQEEDDQRQFQKMLERGNLPWFEYKVGNDAGSYQIASPRLTVGRDNSSDWVVPHKTVSRKHFEITFKDHVYTIKDLGSSNGLSVNGQVVSTCELRHGDLIQAGELVLTFHI